MKAALLFVGDEVVDGLIENTNASFLVPFLASFGVDVDYVMEVRDELQMVRAALVFLKEFAQLVVVCGGLGPTEDGITRQAIAASLGRRLIFDEGLWTKIEGVLKRRGSVLREEHRRMAYVVEGGEYVDNPVGLAPALVVRERDRFVVALPGVPRELEELSKLVFPQLVGSGERAMEVMRFRLFGLKESEVNARAKEVLSGFAVRWGTVIRDGEVWLNVKVDPSQKDIVRAQVERVFGESLFGMNDDSLEVVVGRLLKEKGLSLAVAESCTGGLLANLITNVSGSSDYFKGGVVAYLEEVKAEVLGVSWEAIRKFTVYSHEVAKEMAEGVRRLLKSDVGLSTTGIAGPTGGTPEKPVGTVYVGFAFKDKVDSFEFRFNYDRIGNKIAFAKAALDVLRRYLEKDKGLCSS